MSLTNIILAVMNNDSTLKDTNYIDRFKNILEYIIQE